VCFAPQLYIGYSLDEWVGSPAASVGGPIGFASLPHGSYAFSCSSQEGVCTIYGYAHFS